MIDPITGLFEIQQYQDKIVISIVISVKTVSLSRYFRPVEVTYDQGSEFIGNEF